MGLLGDSAFHGLQVLRAQQHGSRVPVQYYVFGERHRRKTGILDIDLTWCACCCRPTAFPVALVQEPINFHVPWADPIFSPLWLTRTYQGLQESNMSVCQVRASALLDPQRCGRHLGHLRGLAAGRHVSGAVRACRRRTCAARPGRCGLRRRQLRCRA